MRFKAGLSLLFVVLMSLAIPVARSAEGAQRYIVVLKQTSEDPATTAEHHSSRCGVRPDQFYRHALRGYAGTIPDSRVSCVRSDSRVSYIERDGIATVVAQTLPWGINRIEADVNPTVLAGNGSGTVTNVRAYIIDTGIATHSDLNVVGHVNFAGGKNTDCHGHGTHVAGTVAAKDNTQDVVGVVPGAPLIGVKVLSCSGSGAWSGIIKGIDWVTGDATKPENIDKPAVANMSIGGGAVTSVDTAVKNSALKGVFYALAAGNEGDSACNHSPARAGTASGVVTVAATDSSEKEASWSNYGSCVDIWAPGVSVLSTRRGGGTTTMSGTSMASPHIAGGGALYRSKNAATPGAVEDALKNAAQPTETKSKDGRWIVREDVRTF